jgi:alpha-galactosidase
MLAAPLISGNDIRNMSKETLEILTNKEAIAIDQDALGVECYKLFDRGDFEVYAKPLSNNELAICFLNRGNSPINFEFKWKDFPISDGISGKSYNFGKTEYKLHDCWQKKDAGSTLLPFKSTIQPHDVILLRVKP